MDAFGEDEVPKKYRKNKKWWISFRQIKHTGYKFIVYI